jgi:hypothetical protein
MARREHRPQDVGGPRRRRGPDQVAPLGRDSLRPPAQRVGGQGQQRRAGLVHDGDPDLVKRSEVQLAEA